MRSSSELPNCGRARGRAGADIVIAFTRGRGNCYVAYRFCRDGALAARRSIIAQTEIAFRSRRGDSRNSMPAATPSRRAHPVAVIAAGALVCLSAGSIYGWSLFYQPIEADLKIGRAWLSGAFSIASILFAAAMVVAPMLFRGRPAPLLALLSGILCAAGTAIPGLVRELWCVVAGYGLLFGAGCGIAYSVALQANMMALPQRRGLAAGLTAGSGALGSVAAAIAFRAGITAFGPWQTLIWAGVFFVAVSLLAAALMRGIAMPVPGRSTAANKSETAAERRIEITLWLGFFFGACAGLMALGHAAGIALAYGGALAPVALATALITGGNGIGRLGAGWLADLLPVRRILVAAPLLAALALAALALVPDASLALVVLAATGLAYGAMAATYPASVAIYFGVARTATVYGRVFTSWGIAGLAAPGLGGYIFDLSGGYAVALGLAAGAGLLSAAVAWTLPPAAK
jgi:MFS transporter, OFA family, oxalate/formate antiporter